MRSNLRTKRIQRYGSGADRADGAPSSEPAPLSRRWRELAGLPRLEERSIIPSGGWARPSAPVEALDFLSILVFSLLLLSGLRDSDVLGVLLGSRSLSLLEVLSGVGLASMAVWCYRRLGLYHLGGPGSVGVVTARELKAYLGTLSVSVFGAGIYSLFVPLGLTAQLGLPFAVLTLVWIGRSLVRLRLSRQRAIGVRNVVLVGSGPRARRLATILQSHSSVNYEVMGYLDLRRGDGDLAGLPYLGTIEQLPDLAAGFAIDEIYLAMPVRSCYDEMERAAALARESGLPVLMPVDVLDSLPSLAESDRGVGPMVSSPETTRSHLALLVKRMTDIAISSVALLCCVPLFLAIAVAIRVDSKGGAIFRQTRVGRGRRSFTILKFRTMKEDAETILKNNPALSDLYVRNNYKIPIDSDFRLTRVGHWLRRFSLDELPQLWNVLRGDMSLVGPRPVVPDELGHYGPVAPVMLRFRPGLTGEWVAAGQDAVSYPKRAEIELSYVRQWSLKRDLWILYRTIRAVLTRVRVPVE